MSEMQSLYDKDFYAWTIDIIDKLKTKQLNDLDIDHLIEEVESMGISEKRALESRLVVLLTHLLKWQIQKDMRCNSWKRTIEQQRLKIRKLIKSMPSLKNLFSELINDEDNYKDAVLSASSETGIDITIFPIKLPYTIEQIFDEGYYPD